eukprot:gene5326-495_t
MAFMHVMGAVDFSKEVFEKIGDIHVDKLSIQKTASRQAALFYVQLTKCIETNADIAACRNAFKSG